MFQVNVVLVFHCLFFLSYCRQNPILMSNPMVPPRGTKGNAVMMATEGEW